MSIDLPNQDVLFAVYAVQLGFCTPNKVADAAAKAANEPKRSLGDILERDGAINAQQRQAIQRRLEREVREGCETISTLAPSKEMVIPARVEAPTVDLGLMGDATLAEPPSIDPGPLDEEIDDRISDAQAGHYTVQGQHASGGQARIMLAIDEQIGREVAIKELIPDSGSDWATDTPISQRLSTPGTVRFLREARVTGQLEHPNIVPVHEVGRREDGSLYYTMRFVRGETMARRLKDCKTLADRMKLLGAFWDVCNAISFAHSRGVVHRDLKPENIMTGEFGETVVIDWGVAKVAGKQDIRATDIERELRYLKQQDTSKTAAGTAIGTPSYMSPEQAKGDIDEIDERSDVWGLGALLYEILTGRPPYVGETPMEIILKVGSEPIEPVRGLCPEAPAELAAVAEKSLNKDRAGRYQSARELTTEIDAFMTGSRVTAYDYSSWELLKRFARQNRKTIAAVAIILGVILGALISVTMSLKSETRAREAEHQALTRAEAARGMEQTERRVANFHLAQAYAEKSARMLEDLRHLSARVYAAASLLHNPAHPKSPFHTPDFAGKLPSSRGLWVEAASRIFRLQFGLEAKLERHLAADEVLTRVAFHPNGTLLAAGSFDHKVWLWTLPGDPAEERVIARQLSGHSQEVYGVAFSPKGRLLATSDRKGEVILWRVESGKIVRRLKLHTAMVHQVAFSPDGSLLASASWDGTCRLVQVPSGKSLMTLEHTKNKVYGLAFSPDGKSLATASGDGKLRIWSLKNGKLERELSGHEDEIYAVAFSPNGRLLASAGNDRTIFIWRTADGKRLHRMQGHKDGVLSLDFSPDGSSLASASYDRSVRFWNPISGQALSTIGVHKEFVFGAAFSPDGKTLATTGYDRSARLWSLNPGRSLPVLTGHTGTIYALAFTPGGERIISGSWDHTLRIWDPKRGRTMKVLRGHTDIVDNLAVNPDGRRLASASRDRSARVWDLSTGKELYKLTAHRDKVSAVAFSPDGELLATGGSDKTIRVWEAATGRPVHTISGHTDDIANLAFSPDGHSLASVSNDVSVRLWDPRTGDQIRVLKGHTDWISGVSFSPDGSQLATSGKDGQAIIWDTSNGIQLRALSGHSQWVNNVVYSHDGKLLATGSDDRTVRLWDASDGRPLLTIEAELEVVALGFSPDGKQLAIGDGQAIRLYPLDFTLLEQDPQGLLERAERQAGVHMDGFSLEVLDAQP